MNKQLTLIRVIASIILTATAIFLVTAFITFGIDVLICRFNPIALGSYGVFYAPFIFIGVLLVEVIIYWIVCAVISIIKSIRKHRHSRLAL